MISQTDMGNFVDYYHRIIEEAPRGATVVEVGVMRGVSLSQLAVEGYPKGIQVYGVDWGRGLDGRSPTANDFTMNLVQTNIPYSVPVIVWDSALASRLFRDRSLWFVYIDADHREEAVRRDIRHWMPKVKRGGILAGHDYWLDEVKAAVHSYFGECQSRTNPDVWEVRRTMWGWKHV